jgi:hypothetical protein
MRSRLESLTSGFESLAVCKRHPMIAPAWTSLDENGYFSAAYGPSQRSGRCCEGGRKFLRVFAAGDAVLRFGTRTRRKGSGNQQLADSEGQPVPARSPGIPIAVTDIDRIRLSGCLSR